MATRRPTQLPGGGVLTRMLGLGPYDDARQRYEQIYAPGYPSRNNYFPIDGYRRQCPNPLHSAGLHGGSHACISNNCYHSSHHSHGGKRHHGNHYGVIHIGNLNGNNSARVHPRISCGHSSGIDQFRRDLFDRERSSQHFRHRTENQLRELRNMLEHDHHLTRQDMHELAHGTNEKCDLIISLLRRQDARIDRGEDRLQRHRQRREGNHTRHWGDLRPQPQGFGHPQLQPHPYAPDPPLERADDFDYASSTSGCFHGSDDDGERGRRFRPVRRRHPSPVSVEVVQGQRYRQ